MTTIDLGPVIQALAGLVLAAVLPAIPILVATMRKKLNLQITDAQVAAITGAAQQGANFAYGMIVKSGGSVAAPQQMSQAITAGVNHVLSSVPDALKTIGITPQHVSAMVEARLGGLLAADPTVTVAAKES